jgi:hypothetical protein
MKELLKTFLKELITILVIVVIFSAIFSFFEGKFGNNSKNSFDSTVLKKLDSIQKQTNILKSHIDSINLLKKEQLNVYYKTKWKYDTLKITIDTMPPLDATKLLLSKSRQLTNKGIE